MIFSIADSFSLNSLFLVMVAFSNSSETVFNCATFSEIIFLHWCFPINFFEEHLKATSECCEGFSYL